ncbi:MAG: hypothetical protein WC650_03740 [Candidatus Doudnabacteria bacterium]
MSDLILDVNQHIIDCDADPFLPTGWKVEKHYTDKGSSGQFAWDSANVKLYLSENQIDGKYVEGNKLREELADMPVLNANVLDYLLTHPHLIPEEWKKDDNGNILYIFFWGTIYRYSDGDLCVRCLYFFGGEWSWRYRWLGRGWGDDHPAALLAS